MPNQAADTSAPAVAAAGGGAAAEQAAAALSAAAPAEALAKDASMEEARREAARLVAAREAGLTAAGREVWTLGLCPTPAVARLVNQFQAAGGLMVSASHNPPEDNGIKLFGPSGAKLSRDQQQAIEAGLRGEVRPALTSCGPTQRRTELLESYTALLEKSLEGRDKS